jgi:hypothetical protein
MGVPGLRFEVVPHPVAGLDEETAVERGRAAGRLLIGSQPERRPG